MFVPEFQRFQSSRKHTLNFQIFSSPKKAYFLGKEPFSEIYILAFGCLTLWESGTVGTLEQKFSRNEISGEKRLGI